MPFRALVPQARIALATSPLHLRRSLVAELLRLFGLVDLRLLGEGVQYLGNGSCIFLEGAVLFLVLVVALNPKLLALLEFLDLLVKIGDFHL